MPSKRVAIIQARMGSSRLPGKVLADIAGRSMLARVLDQCRAVSLIEQVIVATTTAAEDDAIVCECRRLVVDHFRGAASDVLDRYYQAAKNYSADVIVRVTADCPLLQPGIVDLVVQALLHEEVDYASNTHDPQYLRGTDAEAFTFSALERSWREATESHQREHVTPYIYEHPELFRITSVPAGGDFSSYRFTVDTRDDLEFVRSLCRRLNGGGNRLQDILEILQREPELLLINQRVRQKQLREV